MAFASISGGLSLAFDFVFTLQSPAGPPAVDGKEIALKSSLSLKLLLSLALLSSLKLLSFLSPDFTTLQPAFDFIACLAALFVRLTS